MAMYIQSPDWMDDGLAPRQRRLHVLRWNPRISSYTPDAFEGDFKSFKDYKAMDMDWSVFNWKEVMHLDLFVMMKVGTNSNGIVWFGYLRFPPYQLEYEDGHVGRTRYFETVPMFMHRIEKTGLLTAEKLNREIPEVNWEHGHSGEMLSVEAAEKLGLLIGRELMFQEDGEDLKFEEFSQKPYVISDFLGYLCPQLKQKFIDEGKVTEHAVPEKGVNHNSFKFHEELVAPGVSLEDVLELDEIGLQLS